MLVVYWRLFEVVAMFTVYLDRAGPDINSSLSRHCVRRPRGVFTLLLKRPRLYLAGEWEPDWKGRFPPLACMSAHTHPSPCVSKLFCVL